MTDPVALFQRIFLGRNDIRGGDAGQCIYEPALYGEYRDHLMGNLALGIYPIVKMGDECYVRFGAIDIDYEDLTEAENVRYVLGHKGIPSFIERSMSKGYHVWVFVEDWIPARVMRRALLVVRDFLKLKAREVYPKQETLSADKPNGNYIRLPYPNGMNNSRPERRVMIEPSFLNTPYSLLGFLSAVEFADPDKLRRLAERWVEPKRVNVDFQTDGEIESLARQTLNQMPDGLAWHIVKEGPLDGEDRSGTLVRLCNVVKERGASATGAFAILVLADQQEWCQKYCARTDGWERLEEIVRKGYGQEIP